MLECGPNAASITAAQGRKAARHHQAEPLLLRLSFRARPNSCRPRPTSSY